MFNSLMAKSCNLIGLNWLVLPKVESTGLTNKAPSPVPKAIPRKSCINPDINGA